MMTLFYKKTIETASFYIIRVASIVYTLSFQIPIFQNEIFTKKKDKELVVEEKR